MRPPHALVKAIAHLDRFVISGATDGSFLVHDSLHHALQALAVLELPSAESQHSVDQHTTTQPEQTPPAAASGQSKQKQAWKTKNSAIATGPIYEGIILDTFGMFAIGGVMGQPQAAADPEAWPWWDHMPERPNMTCDGLTGMEYYSLAPVQRSRCMQHQR